MKNISFLIFAIVTPFAVSAQGFDQVETESQNKLETALEQLADLREEITAEKVPLSTDIAQLQKQVIELRKQRERLQQVQDSRTLDISSIQSQVDALRDQKKYINDLIQEFTSHFASSIHYSEVPYYEDVIHQTQIAPDSSNLSAEQKQAAQLSILAAALQRLEKQIGGNTYKGQAYSPEGVLLEGTFIALGPAVYFVSDNKQFAGLVQKELNSDYTSIIPLDGMNAPSALIGLATEGEGIVALDPTGGRALKVERASKGLLGYVSDGGVIGYVIIALGIVSLLMALFKALEIISFPILQPKNIEAVINTYDDSGEAEALKEAHQQKGIVGDMLDAGVRFIQEKRGTLEEVMYEKILRVRPMLERFLPFLAITAATAPLLGLLGTVVGMIKTFNLITIFGTGDAKSLSSGISEALVTTALGLIVAIPILLLHGVLSRMAKRKIGLLEQGAVSFINMAVSRRHGIKQDDQ